MAKTTGYELKYRTGEWEDTIIETIAIYLDENEANQMALYLNKIADEHRCYSDNPDFVSYLDDRGDDDGINNYAWELHTLCERRLTEEVEPLCADYATRVHVDYNGIKFAVTPITVVY